MEKMQRITSFLYGSEHKFAQTYFQSCCNGKHLDHVCFVYLNNSLCPWISSVYYIDIRLRIIIKAELSQGQKWKRPTGHASNVGVVEKLLSHHFGAIFDHCDFSKLQHSRLCYHSSSANLPGLVELLLTPLCSKPTRMDVGTAQLPLSSSSPTAAALEEGVVSEFVKIPTVYVLTKASKPTQVFES